MAYLDYSTFLLTGPGTGISVAAGSLTLASLSSGQQSVLSLDRGVGGIAGNIRVLTTINATGNTGHSCGICGFGDAAHSIQQMITAQAGWGVQHAFGPVVRLQSFVSGGGSTDSNTLTLGTTYYLDIRREGSTGYVHIATGTWAAFGGSLVQTLSRAVPTSAARYIHALQTRDNGLTAVIGATIGQMIYMPNPAAIRRLRGDV